jgi:S-adenosylmethionine/arginine decarboxylase-like enzyme
MAYWGYHAMFDCSRGDVEKVRDGDNIRAFVKELVPAIDMVAYGEPTVVHFAQHDDTKSGYSLCQMIETSSITGHFVDSNGDFYIDVFSCKEVNVDVCCQLIEKYFTPEKVRSYFLTRSAG